MQHLQRIRSRYWETEKHEKFVVSLIYITNISEEGFHVNSVVRKKCAKDTTKCLSSLYNKRVCQLAYPLRVFTCLITLLRISWPGQPRKQRWMRTHPHRSDR